jgi:hypothetical protein
MPTQSKRSVDRFECRQEALGLLRRLEALHLSLSDTGWLMRVLGSVIQIAVLPMHQVGTYEFLRCGVTPQLVRDDDARCSLCCME